MDHVVHRVLAELIQREEKQFIEGSNNVFQKGFMARINALSQQLATQGEDVYEYVKGLRAYVNNHLENTILPITSKALASRPARLGLHPTGHDERTLLYQTVKRMHPKAVQMGQTNPNEFLTSLMQHGEERRYNGDDYIDAMRHLIKGSYNDRMVDCWKTPCRTRDRIH